MPTSPPGEGGINKPKGWCLWGGGGPAKVQEQHVLNMDMDIVEYSYKNDWGRGHSPSLSHWKNSLLKTFFYFIQDDIITKFYYCFLDVGKKNILYLNGFKNVHQSHHWGVILKPGDTLARFARDWLVFFAFGGPTEFTKWQIIDAISTKYHFYSNHYYTWFLSHHVLNLKRLTGSTFIGLQNFKK